MCTPSLGIQGRCSKLYFVPGVQKQLSPFEQFQNNNHCLALSDVNGNLLLKGSLGSVLFYAIFAHQKTSKIWIFRKSYAGEVLEKVGNLAMEIYSIPSMFYIINVKAYNHLSIS